MTPERLYSLLDRGIAFDTETHPITPSVLAPPLVVGSVAWYDVNEIDGVLLRPEGVVGEKALDKVRRQFDALLDDPDAVIIGANVAFDMLVMAVDAGKRGIDLMPKIFEAYRAGRVYDIQQAEKLHAIACGTLGSHPRNGGPLKDPATGKQGRYSLAITHELVTGKADAKANDEYRLRYAELEGVPVEAWPVPARVYPVDDVRNTLEDALIQVGHLPRPVVTAAYQRVGEAAPNRNLHDLAAQCYKAFALHLGAAWGFQTDQDAVRILREAALSVRGDLERFVEAGLVRADGSADKAVLKRMVAKAYGCEAPCKVEGCKGGKVKSPKSGNPINCPTCGGTGYDLDAAPVPRTAKDGVSTERSVLIDSGDELVMEFAESGESKKIVETYCPSLERPTITLKPNNPLETARVSYSGAEQTYPRQVGARLAEALRKVRAQMAEVASAYHAPYGVRDCIKARRGKVFYSVDYEGGELVTHAQSCKNLVGFSAMGDALARGVNVHGALGATMMGAEYDDFMRRLKKLKDRRCKDFRQAAKPGNFGFPGGMGSPKLVQQQRKPGGSIPDTPHESGPSLVWDGDAGAWVPGYRGVRFCVLVGAAERCGEVKITEWKNRPYPPLCLACVKVAEHIRETWFRQWPENKPYFDYVSRTVDDVGEVVQHYSGRIRGGLDFCAAANGYFQAFLADIAGRAQCRVSYEQYVDKRSVLYGTRSILFAHDELFGEAPEDIAADAANRVAEIMVEEFREGCPDYAAACKAEPALARRWYKDMSPTFDSGGRLIPWEPRA